MEQYLIFYGFCPTLEKDYSIEVKYSQISGNRYLQTGADCEYRSMNPCPNDMNCPLRAKAPREKVF